MSESVCLDVTEVFEYRFSDLSEVALITLKDDIAYTVDQLLDIEQNRGITKSESAPATPTAHKILDPEAETPETTIESEVDHTGKIKNTPKLMHQKKTTNAPKATEGNKKQSKPATTQIQTLAQEKRLRSTSRQN
ncbi:hypothetical protein JTB14_034097 [Gonioctena quinquepunctata]|nr:hypothetical protein JTB14_034097 [Gonioctena quinquepunctata]